MNLKLAKLFLLSTSIGFHSVSLAHGENKPGPHGGQIQMPGAFHTELVQEGNNRLRVYLLDLQFKNPTTKNSNIEAEIQDEMAVSKLLCKTEETFFVCDVPKAVGAKKGLEVHLTATRAGAKGQKASYKISLKKSCH